MKNGSRTETEPPSVMPSKNILIAAIPVSLYMPIGLDSLFGKSFGQAAFFCATVLCLVNFVFLVRLAQQDEERKCYNYFAFCGSLWTFLHFGTVNNGMLSRIAKFEHANYSALSFIAAISVLLSISIWKLVSRWAVSSQLYKIAYLVTAIICVGILGYYFLHPNLVFVH